MSRWRWLLTQLSRRLWVHTTLLGLLGVVTALVAGWADYYLPWEPPIRISPVAVDNLLTIIANSMLAVTTFSLSVVTAAYSVVTSTVTPNATQLLIEDRITQKVLGTFMGSFIFSIVILVALKTGAFDNSGNLVLFVVTIAMIVLIVVWLLRWINHLIRLGRVSETSERVEQATAKAITARLAQPYLGGQPLRGLPHSVPATAHTVLAEAVGYVQHIDMGALERCAASQQAAIYLVALPGTLVYADTPLAWITPADGQPPDDATRQTLQQAFLLGSSRRFDQDPRFGLVVMSEIGIRALATNDPGTAINVISRSARLITQWVQGSQQAQPSAPDYPHVHVPPVATADLIEDAFMLLARDGAGKLEVQLRLQKTLLALGRLGDTDCHEAARAQAMQALSRAEDAMSLAADRARVLAATHGWHQLRHQPPRVESAAQTQA